MIGHYFSKNKKTSIIHSTLYAAVLALLSGLAFYSIYALNEGFADATSANIGNLPLLFGVLRAAVFFVSTPIITYSLNRFYSHRRL